MKQSHSNGLTSIFLSQNFPGGRHGDTDPRDNLGGASTTPLMHLIWSACLPVQKDNKQTNCAKTAEEMSLPPLTSGSNLWLDCRKPRDSLGGKITDINSRNTIIFKVTRSLSVPVLVVSQSVPKPSIIPGVPQMIPMLPNVQASQNYFYINNPERCFVVYCDKDLQHTAIFRSEVELRLRPPIEDEFGILLFRFWTNKRFLKKLFAKVTHRHSQIWNSAEEDL